MEAIDVNDNKISWSGDRPHAAIALLVAKLYYETHIAQGGTLKKAAIPSLEKAKYESAHGHIKTHDKEVIYLDSVERLRCVFENTARST